MARKRKKQHYSGIGGQAVLEGIMMKNKEHYAVAVRKPNGEIAIEVDNYQGIAHDSKLAKVPFIRGVFNFIDSLVLGMKTLNYSASFYEEDEGKDTAADIALEKASGGHEERFLVVLTTVVSFILAIGIFMLLPFFLTNLLTEQIRNASLIAIIEGLVRIAIFVVYIVAISLMKDIRRVYMYHGAEHKCINCLEKGRPLTVHNVMRSSRQHKRCGTSFLLLVVLISVIVFFFIRVDNLALKVLFRILLIPVIAGIAYEVLRLAGRSENILVRIISAPGMLLQRLTTREPDEDMVEVAIAAVEAVFDWKAFLKEEFDYDVDDSWLVDSTDELPDEVDEAKESADDAEEPEGEAEGATANQETQE